MHIIYIKKEQLLYNRCRKCFLNELNCYLLCKLISNIFVYSILSLIAVVTFSMGNIEANVTTIMK